MTMVDSSPFSVCRAASVATSTCLVAASLATAASRSSCKPRSKCHISTNVTISCPPSCVKYVIPLYLEATVARDILVLPELLLLDDHTRVVRAVLPSQCHVHPMGGLGDWHASSSLSDTILACGRSSHAILRPSFHEPESGLTHTITYKMCREVRRRVYASLRAHQLSRQVQHTTRGHVCSPKKLKEKRVNPFTIRFNFYAKQEASLLVKNVWDPASVHGGKFRCVSTIESWIN